jgi:HEAT repeat protein
MSPSQLVERVMQKDWTVVSATGSIGAAAAPELLAALESFDPQVRELALACLNEAGGPAARQGLIQSLRDANEGVRGAAAQYLRAHYTPEDVPAIQIELEHSPDPYVREHLALLLGTTSDAGLIPFLREHFDAEKDPGARWGFTLALARLGDKAGRQRLIGTLLKPDPIKVQVSAIRDLPYVNDPQLLQRLAPLLDDTRPAQNIGGSHRPRYIRLCDVVVNVADQILGHRFRWANGSREYSPQELKEVGSAIMTPSR